MSRTSDGIIATFVGVFLLVVMIVTMSPSASAKQITPDDFEFRFNDPPPTGPPNFTVRTTTYHFALEDEHPIFNDGTRKGFHGKVRLEGTGFTREGLIISHADIKPTREESVPFFETPQKRLDISKRYVDRGVIKSRPRPPYRPERTIAVNLKKDTPCHIPRYSRVYIKYREPNHPFTGWYVAEDTGGAFVGRCKIDIFTGVGSNSKSQGKSGTVRDDPAVYPEVWVFPGENTFDLHQGDNIYTKILNQNVGPGGSSIGVGTSNPVTTPPISHPLFNVPYSVDPSFSVTTKYDFDIYKTAQEQVKKLNSCKGNITCIVRKVYDLEAETFDRLNWMVKYGGSIITRGAELRFIEKLLFLFNPEETDVLVETEIGAWEDHCEDENANAVTSLAEAIETAKSAPEPDCVLPYYLPVQRPEEIEEEQLLGLFTTIKTVYEPWDERSFRFERKKENIKGSNDKVITLIHTDVKMTAPSNDEKTHRIRNTRVSPSSISYDNKDAGKIILIRKTGRNSVELGPVQDNNPEEYKEKMCNPIKKTIKFCIVQNDTFVAYDVQNNVAGRQLNVVKFAYSFEGELPNVKNVRVRDAKIARNSIIISWDEIEAAAIKDYVIYFAPDASKESLLKKPTKELTDEVLNDENVIKQISPVLEAEEAKSLDITSASCLVDPNSGTCFVSYSLGFLGIFGTKHLETNKLYYDPQFKKFHYILADSRVPDGKNFAVGVSAIDDSGEQTEKVTLPASKQPTPGVFEQSVNDLPPALPVFTVGVSADGTTFNFALENDVDKYIDGTTFLDSEEEEDLGDYKIYCFNPTVVEGVFNINSATPVTTVDAPGTSFSDNGIAVNNNCGPPFRFIITSTLKDEVTRQDIEYRGPVPAGAVKQPITTTL